MIWKSRDKQYKYDQKRIVILLSPTSPAFWYDWVDRLPDQLNFKSKISVRALLNRTSFLDMVELARLLYLSEVRNLHKKTKVAEKWERKVWSNHNSFRRCQLLRFSENKM